jgi:hypothetical protein
LIRFVFQHDYDPKQLHKRFLEAGARPGKYTYKPRSDKWTLTIDDLEEAAIIQDQRPGYPVPRTVGGYEPLRTIGHGVPGDALALTNRTLCAASLHHSARPLNHRHCPSCRWRARTPAGPLRRPAVLPDVDLLPDEEGSKRFCEAIMELTG